MSSKRGYDPFGNLPADPYGMMRPAGRKVQKMPCNCQSNRTDGSDAIVDTTKVVTTGVVAVAGLGVLGSMFSMFPRQ